MAPTVPAGEPTRVTAGDTWTWRKRHGDYPVADGWVLSYSIRGLAAPNWDGSWVVVDGDDWLVTIPAGETANLAAGTYAFAAHYTLAGARYTEPLPPLRVAADLNQSGAGDEVDHAARMVPLLEAAIESLTAGKVAVYQLGSRLVTYHDLPELRKLLGQYRAEVRRHQTPDRLTRPIPVRFLAPR